MRLNRFLAKSAICSRRKADTLIAAGRVRVNHQPVTQLGILVEAGDMVEVDGKVITPPEKFTYYALYKPRGYVSSVSDPLGRPCIVELVPGIPKVYPVGRLDIESEGLILLTNDGDFTYQMTHPKNQIAKTYEVWLKGKISDRQINKLCNKIKLNDGTTQPALVTRLTSNKIEITIHEGRNRQIRRMLGTIGHEVVKLVRISEGEINLDGLTEGEYRIISPK